MAHAHDVPQLLDTYVYFFNYLRPARCLGPQKPCSVQKRTGLSINLLLLCLLWLDKCRRSHLRPSFLLTREYFRPFFHRFQKSFSMMSFPRSFMAATLPTPIIFPCVPARAFRPFSSYYCHGLVIAHIQSILIRPSSTLPSRATVIQLDSLMW